jgi:uncharacterized OB-fold protein
MEQMICHHKWKVIRAEEGQKQTLLSLLGLKAHNIIIYHLQCEKCGLITVRYSEVCDRSYDYTILKEVKFK